MNENKNIKNIKYDGEFKIIKSIDGYQLHEVGLISDKYAALKGLAYPLYFTLFFDIEKLEVVKTWENPNNDFFLRQFEKINFYRN